MPERRTLADSWVIFLSQCIPEQASITQQVETRRAYYAGAAALFGLISTGLDEDKEPTVADVEHMEALYQELKVFAKDLEEGRV